MSCDGGKIKPKKRLAHSKPYDRNLTLFGKLKKSVTDLLVPSWLLSSHQQNERPGTSGNSQASQFQASTVMQMDSNSFTSGNAHDNRVGDGVDTIDQTPMFVDVTTKVQRREQYGLYRGTNAYSGESSFNQHLSDKVSSASGDPLYNADMELVSDQENSNTPRTPKVTGVEQQESREKAESISSQFSKRFQSQAEKLKSDVSGGHHIMTSTRVHNQSLDISQNASKRQRLWTPESNKQGINLFSPVKEKPSFNAVLLGSMSDSSVFGDSLNNSVFYPGKTQFGGASAQRRTSLNTSLPYQSSLPLRKQVRAHNVSKNIQATTSATAQRILETLDRMSTPLADAKKMPIASTSTNDSVLSFVPSSYRQGSLVTGRPVSRPLQIPTRGPPTSQHQALAQAVLAKNRYQSNVVDQRQKSMIVGDEDSDQLTSGEIARLSNVVRPSVSSEITGQQTLGKMKVKRFYQHISSAGSHDDQVAEVPNLRTDFTLPVSNMMPITLQSYSVKSHTTTESSIPLSDVTVPTKFIFSAPIDVDAKKQAQCQITNTTDKNFQFTSPIKTSQSKTSAVGAEGGSKTCQEPAVGASSGTPVWTPFTASVPAWSSTTPKPKVSSPDIGGTSSSFKSYNKWGSFEKIDDSSAASDTSTGGFSLAPAASLKSGSVMDILGGGKSTGADDLMAKFKKPAGSWKCETCMIVNKPDVGKCVCCDTARPGGKTASDSATKSSINTATSVHADSLKAQSGTSGCDNSTVTSKFDVGKSIGSETFKPGIKQSINGTASVNSLSALFKKPVGNWECETCMVQNTAVAVRCIACDSSKPGLQSAGVVSKAPSTSSTIVISPTGGFTFNTSVMTTTTSGSGGFRFDTITSSSTPSTSVPSSTGFIFGQTISSNKNSSSKTCSSSSSTPLTGGFKFEANSPGSDSGGTVSGTFGTGVSNSGSGFKFGNSGSNAASSESGQTVSDWKSAIADSKTSCSNIAVTDSRSDVDKNGTTDLNTLVSKSAAVFQFGTVTSTTSTSASSGTLQSSTESNLNDNNAKLPHKEVNFNFVPVSTAPSLFAPPTLQQSEKVHFAAAKAASTMFQFGASSVTPVSNSGLGMGTVLSDNKPVINGGFGSGLDLKASSKSAPTDSNKSLQNFTFGTSNVFGGFGQSSGNTESAFVQAAQTGINQTSQSGKRTVDFTESDQPSVKKSFNFGAGANEHSSNGLFTFGGSSETKASPFVVSSASTPSTGGFNFNSNPPATQTSGPAPEGGFQFALGSTAKPVSQGFDFSLKAQRPKPYETATNTGALQMNTNANFNFGPALQQTPVFQFGAKPVESAAAAASGVFSFGATHQSSVSSDGSNFGTITGVGSVGNFNIGTGDSSRKFKKGVRRMKK